MAVGAIPQDPRLVGTDASGLPKLVEATGEAGHGRLSIEDRSTNELLGEMLMRLDAIFELLVDLKE